MRNFASRKRPNIKQGPIQQRSIKRLNIKPRNIKRPNIQHLPIQLISYQQAYDYPEYKSAPPARIVEAAPRNTPQVTQEISFVKMGGGSDMQDWASCEAQAGGFVTVVQGGYLIDPAFESCMRSKGYKPESEAAHELSL